MIFSLRGWPEEFIPPNRLILRAGPLNFEIFLPLRTFQSLKESLSQQEINLYIAVVLIQKEFWQAFGFVNKQERELFLKLNKLYQVGPTLALNILSYYTTEDLKQIVLHRRVEALAKVPGIGIKRAEKLILELKGLYERISKKGVTIPEPTVDLLNEAKECLVNLGFSAKEAERVLLKVFHEGDTLESLLKKSLRELAPGQDL